MSRTPVSGVAIRVRFSGAADLEQCYLRDISRGGIFLRARNLRAPQTPLTVVLTMPDGGELRLHGEVVHVVTPEAATPDKPTGMGVQFLDLTADTRLQIERYIERLRNAPLAASAAPRPVAPEASQGFGLPPTLEHTATRLTRPPTGGWRVPAQRAALTPETVERTAILPPPDRSAMKPKTTVVKPAMPEAPPASTQSGAGRPIRMGSRPSALKTPSVEPTAWDIPSLGGVPAPVVESTGSWPAITIVPASGPDSLGEPSEPPSSAAGVIVTPPSASRPPPPPADLERTEILPSVGQAASSEIIEEEDERALLRRLCFMLAEGSLRGRPLDMMFGIPAEAPNVLRVEIYERLRAALSPEQPPRYMKEEEARAIARVLAILESFTHG
jgi:molecular chaperone DnaK